MGVSSSFKPLLISIAVACVSTSQISTSVLANESNELEQTSAADQLNLDIASGTLAKVLNELASVAGVALSYAPELTAGKSSTGLKGAYTLEQAFTKILSDHYLYAEESRANTYKLITVENHNSSTKKA